MLLFVWFLRCITCISSALVFSTCSGVIGSPMCYPMQGRGSLVTRMQPICVGTASPLPGLRCRPSWREHDCNPLSPMLHCPGKRKLLSCGWRKWKSALQELDFGEAVTLARTRDLGSSRLPFGLQCLQRPLLTVYLLCNWLAREKI